MTPKTDCCPQVENPDPGGGEICGGGVPLICYIVEVYRQRWENGVLYGYCETVQYCSCF